MSKKSKWINKKTKYETKIVVREIGETTYIRINYCDDRRLLLAKQAKRILQKLSKNGGN